MLAFKKGLQRFPSPFSKVIRSDLGSKLIFRFHIILTHIKETVVERMTYNQKFLKFSPAKP